MFNTCFSSQKLNIALVLADHESQAQLIILVRSRDLKYSPHQMMVQPILLYTSVVKSNTQHARNAALTCLLFLPLLQANFSLMLSEQK